MSRININIGTSANDRTGDPLRTAFDKVNQNFVELYASPYTATTSGDWNGTAPTTLGEAIDRLATLVKALNNGTGA